MYIITHDTYIIYIIITNIHNDDVKLHKIQGGGVNYVNYVNYVWPKPLMEFVLPYHELYTALHCRWATCLELHGCMCSSCSSLSGQQHHS